MGLARFSSPDDLTTLAREILEWIEARAPAGLEAEIYLSRGQSRSIEMRRGRLDAVEEGEFSGAGLRLLRQGRAGFSACGGLDGLKIRELFFEALAQLERSSQDYYRSFAPPQDDAGQAASFASSLWDEAILSKPWPEPAAKLQVICGAARKTDARVKDVLHAAYEESRAETAIANTRGLVAVERGTSASAGASVLAMQSGETQIGSAHAEVRKGAFVNFEKLGLQAAQRSCALLGARAAQGGPRAVLFDPWVAGEFLDLIADLLCADMVQKGKSLLAKKLGQKVASEAATFVDDPRLPGGAASSLYDDEGCLTRRKTMIKDGVLQDYFYDLYCANKEGRRPNASAGRGSYRGLPQPSASNFYLAPGGISRESLIAGTTKGLLVLEVMGMHTVDPVSGEFSIGVSGLEVEGGALARPVRSAMISGNLLDLLSRIDAVAGDLAFYGAAGAPRFRVAELSVA